MTAQPIEAEERFYTVEYVQLECRRTLVRAYLYAPVVEHRVTVAGNQTPIYDVLGKDAALFHFTTDEDGDTAIGAQYVEQARSWFESTWSTVAREYAA